MTDPTASATKFKYDGGPFVSSPEVPGQPVKHLPPAVANRRVSDNGRATAYSRGSRGERAAGSDRANATGLGKPEGGSSPTCCEREQPGANYYRGKNENAFLDGLNRRDVDVGMQEDAASGGHGREPVGGLARAGHTRRAERL